MGREIFEKANELKGYVTKLRRHIHKHPELGLKEYETTKLIVNELETLTNSQSVITLPNFTKYLSI